ncbi:inositol monophosphatase family protein [Cellulomonas sp. HZM]|uniref:inositol monophosphatase family protein n=1 Tax=Cellulomonas sp. HZM TaxID=1454010 RepID=UPI000493220E|nr:inositol monophosphatase family protein [Cellulomonas sp. HZM]
MDDTWDVDELLEVARAVALEAGELVRSGRPDRVEVAATKSSAQDVVTEMDVAVERLLRERLALLRPGDGLLGEEGSSTASATGVTWVVDPIDGTVNYLYGLPSYSVSVAAVVGEPDPSAWTVLAACVHAPADGRTYTATAGGGAYLEGRRLTVNQPASLLDSLVATGFGYRVDRRSGQARVLTHVLPRVRDIRRLGSAALDLCELAAGRVDLYYERGLSPWDLAAGLLVATEAGARVSGLRGLPPGAAMTVAGPGELHAELCTLLEAAGADTDPAQ